MKKKISKLSEFCEYLNSCEEWPIEANKIIEANDWIDLTGTEFEVCSDFSDKIIINDDGTYSVVSDKEKEHINIAVLRHHNIVATFNADSFAVENDEELDGVFEKLEGGYDVYYKDDEEFQDLAERLDGNIDTYEYILHNVNVTVGFLK